MTNRTRADPNTSNSIRIIILLLIIISRTTILLFSRIQGKVNQFRSVEHRTMVSVSNLLMALMSSIYSCFLWIGSHFQQQYIPGGRQIQPTSNRASNQNHEQYHAPQSVAFNPRDEPQFTQDQPDYDRGDNPRNSHGTRLRPVSELRKLAVLSDILQHS
jgi:hypothetical protein